MSNEIRPGLHLTRRFFYSSKGLSEEILVVRQWMEEEAEELVQSTVSKLIVLPATLTISYKVSCFKLPSKCSLMTFQATNSDKAKVSNTPDAAHRELERHMMNALANHARRVARWGLAPAVEVERDMLKGMERIWLFVSQNPVHLS
jgi:hypothetical protein